MRKRLESADLILGERQLTWFGGPTLPEKVPDRVVVPLYRCGTAVQKQISIGKGQCGFRPTFLDTNL